MGPGLLALAPAVLGTAGGVASSLIGGSAATSATRDTNAANLALGRETNEQNYRIFQESKDFSREQADTQWEREKEMFNMENAYNNPVEVVKRLRSAGINPALAMSGSLGSAMSSAASGGQSQMASTPSSPTMVAPQMQNPAPYYQNIATGISDAMFKASQISKNIADAKRSGVETKRLEYSLNSFLKEQDANARIAILNADLQERFGYELKDKEVKKLSSEIDKIVFEQDVLQQEFRLKTLEGDIADTNAHILDEKYKRIQEYIDNEIRSQKADIMLKEAEALAIPKKVQAALTSAIAAFKSAGAAELSAQTQKWIAENPQDAISYLIRGLSLNGLDAKAVVKFLGQKFGFLKGDLPTENQVNKLFNTSDWWKVSPITTVGKGIFDLMN